MNRQSKVRRLFSKVRRWVLLPFVLSLVFCYAAYKDVIAVQFFSTDMPVESTEATELIYTPSFAEKVNSWLDKAFTTSWRPVLGILLGLIIVLLCINTYKWLRQYYETKASPDPAAATTAQPLELMAFIGLRSMTVAVPVMYWAVFVGLVWPRITLLPVPALFAQQMSTAIMMFVLAFALTFIGVFIGVKLTRLLYTYTRKAWPFTD